MAKVDFHIHTTNSDGKDSVTDVLNSLSKKTGQTCISFTDHHIFTINETFIHKGIVCIPGIEISSQYQKDSFHLLAYKSEVKQNQALITLLKRIVEGYNQRADKIYSKLTAYGYKLPPLGLIRSGDYPPPVYSYDFISYFKKLLHLSSDMEALIWLKENGNLLYVEEENFLPDPKDVILILKELGYLVIWAHPCVRLMIDKKTEEKFFRFLEMFMDVGLDGLEVFYPKHTDRQIRQLLRIINKSNLVATGGSDYHGAGRVAGNLLIEMPSKYIDNFMLKLGMSP
jgi:3',5'-nucleoside bisphosphate phosphatase